MSSTALPSPYSTLPNTLLSEKSSQHQFPNQEKFTRFFVALDTSNICNLHVAPHRQLPFASWGGGNFLMRFNGATGSEPRSSSSSSSIHGSCK